MITQNWEEKNIQGVLGLQSSDISRLWRNNHKLSINPCFDSWHLFCNYKIHAWTILWSQCKNTLPCRAWSRKKASSFHAVHHFALLCFPSIWFVFFFQWLLAFIMSPNIGQTSDGSALKKRKAITMEVKLRIAKWLSMGVTVTYIGHVLKSFFFCFFFMGQTVCCA